MFWLPMIAGLMLKKKGTEMEGHVELTLMKDYRESRIGSPENVSSRNSKRGVQLTWYRWPITVRFILWSDRPPPREAREALPRYLANFSPRSGRPEFTADADVRAVREKYRLRPLFRSIVPDEWPHVRRRDKRFPQREKERNKREREWGRVVWRAGCGEGREKAPRNRDNGSEGPREWEKEKWDVRYKGEEEWWW